MDLCPVNKYLLVQPLKEEEEQKSSVLIPEGVEIKPESPFSVVQLLSSDSKVWQERLGLNLLCPTHSVENFVFKGETYYLLPESHVMAIFR